MSRDFFKVMQEYIVTLLTTVKRTQNFLNMKLLT